MTRYNTPPRHEPTGEEIAAACVEFRRKRLAAMLANESDHFRQSEGAIRSYVRCFTKRGYEMRLG